VPLIRNSACETHEPMYSVLGHRKGDRHSRMF
jgi:hypothetical protein